MTTFYLASGGDTAAKRAVVARIAAALESAGHVCVYRWWTQPEWDMPPERITPQRWEWIGTMEASAISAADVVIVLLPGGTGTFFEFGFACGLGKRVLLGWLGDAPPSPFVYLRGVYERLQSRGEAAITAELLEVLP